MTVAHHLVFEEQVDTLKGTIRFLLTCPDCTFSKQFDDEAGKWRVLDAGPYWQASSQGHTVGILPTPEQLCELLGDAEYKEAVEQAKLKGQPLIELIMGKETVATVMPRLEKT